MARGGEARSARINIDVELVARRDWTSESLKQAEQQSPIGAPHALRTQFDDAVDTFEGSQELELPIKCKNWWTKTHFNFSRWCVPRAAIVLSVALMPIRAITNISVMIFSVTGRGLAIAAQLAIQSLVTFLSTIAALCEFEMAGTSLFIGAFCGQFAALGVGLVALGRHHVFSLPSRDWLRRAAGTRRLRQRPGLWTGPAALVKMHYSQAQSICMRSASWA